MDLTLEEANRILRGTLAVSLDFLHFHQTGWK
jgi:hypothetical protein